MLGLNQDTVDLILTVAVVFVIPVLGMMIAALLTRQVKRFGFTNAWGRDGEDINIHPGKYP
jgi:hypothetical protein